MTLDAPASRSAAGSSWRRLSSVGGAFERWLTGPATDIRTAGEELVGILVAGVVA